MTTPSTSPTPSPDSESATLDDELEGQGHEVAPESDTIETASGERVPEPGEDGTVADRHMEAADRLDHSGDDH